MSAGYRALMLGVMALTTYLVRMIPFVAFRKKIESPFLLSLLHYMPYTVLAAMTVPAILTSTDSLLSAVVGFAVALVLAFFRRSLLTVVASSCAAALLTSLIMLYI